MARFTDYQVDDARNTDLAAFLRCRGETLRRSSNEWRWVYRDGSGEHDSVTVRGGEWYDHKHGIGGDAIGFLQEYHNLSFREAVAVLLGQSGYAQAPRYQALKQEPQESRSFTPPPKAPNMHRLYAYLCKSRGIASEVVTHFVRAGLLYEDAEYHNAVFIATDEKNEPRGGTKKSTLSGSHFRQTMAGSDTRYAFHQKGESEKLYVFEAAVDMLSFITLHPEGWRQHSYLALDGVASKALLHFLRTHENIREICLCLDNDMAGQQATVRISAQLQELGYDDICAYLSQRKDWNEQLQEQAISRTHDPPEIEMTMG